MTTVVSFEDKDAKTTIMVRVASNQSGEKGSYANASVAKWYDIYHILCLVSYLNERRGDR